jgi:tetratricopeptide (TPR) repeat protein
MSGRRLKYSRRRQFVKLDASREGGDVTRFYRPAGAGSAPATLFQRFLLCCMLALALAGCQTLAEFVAGTMKEGEQLYAQRKYDEAIAKFNEVLRRDPRHFPAHVWIARSHIAKSAWGPAVASARKAREIAPRGRDVIPVLAQALYGAGESALKAGRLRESISLFLEHIELQPSNPAAYVNVARAYLGEKRLAEAFAALSRALGLPADAATRKQALDLLLEGARRALSDGDLAALIRFLSEYVRFDPDDLRVWLDLARAQLKAGNYEGATAAFGGGLKQGAGEGRADLLRELLAAAREAMAANRMREAALLLREYVEHERANIDAYLDLARAWWKAGDRMQALDAVRRVWELNPRQQQTLKYMLEP